MLSKRGIRRLAVRGGGKNVGEDQLKSETDALE